MRLLIDGYNLMYAAGLLGKRLGPDGFRKVRTRFLNDLAHALGALEAQLTTVVFDASAAPEDRPQRASHKGITVIYAVEDENADERIEHLIAAHSSPKTLTVVSSDHRIRQAANRRRAKAVTADEFWTQLRDRKPGKPTPSPAMPPPEERTRQEGPSPGEAAMWLEIFRDVADAPDTREALGSDFVPTDEEIERIRREVEDEP
jgi:predicted RNA-binding protein with PIN domain